MKKGCFLKFIIIFTILVAVILYIVQNKFDEYFLKPGKKIVLSVLEKKWDEQLGYVKHSEEKDSLKSLLQSYVERLDLSSDESGTETETIIEQLREIVSDSTVDAEEVSRIEKLLSESKKNGE